MKTLLGFEMLVESAVSSEVFWVSECLIMKDILGSQSLIGGALINVRGPQVFFFQAVSKLYRIKL